MTDDKQRKIPALRVDPARKAPTPPKPPTSPPKLMPTPSSSFLTDAEKELASFPLDLAEWYEVCLGDATRAERYYRRALELEPTSVAALSGLRALTTSVAESLQLLDRELALANAEERPSLLRERAEVELRLGRLEEAKRTFREVLQLRPRDAFAFAELRRLLARGKALEQFEESIAVGNAHLAHLTDPEHRSAVATDRAILIEHRGNSPEERFVAWMAAQSASREAQLADLGLYRSAFSIARHDVVDGLLKRESELEQSADRKAWVLFERGCQLLSNGRGAEAFPLFAEARALVSGEVAFTFAMESVLSANAQGPELANFWTLALQSYPPAEVGRTQLLLARHYIEHCEYAKATELLLSCVAKNPSQHEAVTLVANLLEREHRFEEAIQVLLAHAQHTPSSVERADSLVRCALLSQNELANVQVAEELFHAALLASPEHTEALANLQTLLAAQGEWGKLLELLERLTSSPFRSTRAGALHRMSMILSTTQGESARAHHVLGRWIRETIGSNAHLLASWNEMARLAREAHLKEEEHQALRQLTLLVETPAEKSQAFTRLARRHLAWGDFAQAKATLEQALAATPMHSEAVVCLQYLYASTFDLETRCHIGSLLAEATAGERSAGYWLDVADGHRRLRRETKPFLDLAKRAAPDWMEVDIAIALESIRSGSLSELASPMEVENRSTLVIRTLLALSRPTDRMREALALWESIRNLRPAAPFAHRALSRIRHAERNWKAYIETTHSWAQADSLLSEALTIDIAVVKHFHATALRTREESIPDELTDVIENSRNKCLLFVAERLAWQRSDLYPRVLRKLAEAYQGSEEGDRVIATAFARDDVFLPTEVWQTVRDLPTITFASRHFDGEDQRVAVTQLAQLSNRRRPSAWLKLAKMLQDRDRPEALSCALRSVEIDKSNLAGWLFVLQLASLLGRLDVVVTAQESIAERVPSPTCRKALHLESASLLQRLGQTQEALDLAERALRLVPDLETARALEVLSRSQGRLARAAEVLGEIASSIADRNEQKQVWLFASQLFAEVGSHPAAVAAIRRASDLAPLDVEVHRALLQCELRAGSVSDCLPRLLRSFSTLSSADNAKDALSFRLLLAEALQSQASSNEQALTHYEAILAAHPDNQEALRGSARVLARSGKIEAARTRYHSYLAHTECNDRVAVLREVVNLPQAEGSKNFVLDLVALDGVPSSAATLYRSIASDDADWSAYLRVLATLQPAPDQAAAIALEIAQTQATKLRDHKAAEATLLAFLRQQPLSIDASLALATLWTSDGRSNDAEVLLTKLLDRYPLQQAVWQAIRATRVARNVEVRQVDEVLHVLTLPIARDVTTLPTEPIAARPATLPESVLDAASSFASPDDKAIALLKTLDPALRTLYPFDHANVVNRVAPRADHIARRLSDAACAVLAIEPLEICVVRGLGHRPAQAELTEKGVTLLSEAALKWTANELAFALSRIAILHATRLASIHRFSARELEMFCAAAARLVHPGYATGLTGEDVLDETSKRLARALSRKERKALETAAQEYAQAPRADFDRVVRSADRTAIRVASLLSASLRASLFVLQAESRDPTKPFSLFLAESTAAQDLLRFWTSQAGVHLSGHLAGR